MTNALLHRSTILLIPEEHGPELFLLGVCTTGRCKCKFPGVKNQVTDITTIDQSSAEFAFRTSLGFDNVPPVPPPRVVDDPNEDLWMPWPWPREGRTLRAFKDEVFIAQAGLSSIIKHIVPLQREHSQGPLTLFYLTASLALYEQLRGWWISIDPALRSLQVMEDAPPQVFMVT
jgi:hypothetical protein